MNSKILPLVREVECKISMTGDDSTNYISSKQKAKIEAKNRVKHLMYNELVIPSGDLEKWRNKFGYVELDYREMLIDAIKEKDPDIVENHSNLLVFVDPILTDNFGDSDVSDQSLGSDEGFDIDDPMINMDEPEEIHISKKYDTLYGGFYVGKGKAELVPIVQKKPVKKSKKDVPKEKTGINENLESSSLGPVQEKPKSQQSDIKKKTESSTDTKEQEKTATVERHVEKTDSHSQNDIRNIPNKIINEYLQDKAADIQPPAKKFIEILPPKNFYSQSGSLSDFDIVDKLLKQNDKRNAES
ncbi:MAG: hypothetical protein MHMPM18_000772 [Marteilia pararefringens]